MNTQIRAALAAVVVTGIGSVGLTTYPASAADPVPLTQRAVAAVMLDHAPTDTTDRGPLFIDKHDPVGTTGADLRYHGDGEYDGDLLRGWVAPTGTVALTCQSRPHCVEQTTAGGEHYLVSWGKAVPEEDPGFVFVASGHGGDYTGVVYAGPAVTANPITHPLEIPVPTIVAIATDPRLRLLTTQDVIDAGAAVTGWAGGDLDPYAYRRVPQTDLGQVAALVTRRGELAAWSNPRVSPLKDDVGPGAVGGRVDRVGVAAIDPSVVDVLAAPQPPAWLTDDPCTTGRFARHCLEYVTGKGPLFLMWRPDSPTRRGTVWVVHERRSQTVAIRLRGDGVPAAADVLRQRIGWARLRHDATWGPIGLTTFQYVVDFDLSVLG